MPIPVTKCQDVLTRWEKSHVLEIAEGQEKVALLGFLAGSAHKESTCNAGDIGDEGLIPGLGRSPGGGNGNPLQYSCMKHSMDRGTWWATVPGVAKSQTWQSTHTYAWVH